MNPFDKTLNEIQINDLVKEFNENLPGWIKCCSMIAKVKRFITMS